MTLLEIMNDVPASQCNCYPDCNETIYETYPTSVPLRKCDFVNFGVSKLCNPGKRLPPPMLYGEEIVRSFDYAPTDSLIYQSISGFISPQLKLNNLRKINDKVFGVESYEPYEKDIAVVEIFFPNSKAMKLKTKAKMNWIDYFSTVGGLLGLVLGMGIISFVELLWLCLRIAARKLNFQNIIP